ncbi:alpha-ketoglutarate-dependent dioxygenase AlkB [Alginatibacterium sediminis]|uniref:Alpha-ketoglutarate-dependent dioxygenase AlkB n=1 Tax=Alginatibacterium sediminis TaxID=2164068 RepID=A0A420E8A2_9ALTE|nr:alpha-ketoglutarate-dependent dioxygenase AlkB [Alginatibacterium sediminis]RKF15635.1 alpha-ketoglutarate-dependent dioxygenase AlkB [Alginatibacterium sediminis]
MKIVRQTQKVVRLEQHRWFGYHPKWLAKSTCEQLINELADAVQWPESHIHMFGRRIAEPRRSAWFGDPHCSYTYSGQLRQPQAWRTELFQLKILLESELNHNFNSVLVNCYRDGQDYMGWHRDNEKELGQNPLIASISLGASRRFLLRERRGEQQFEFLLGSGDLLVMRAESQEICEHSLPKMRALQQARINLTFRQIKQS